MAAILVMGDAGHKGSDAGHKSAPIVRLDDQDAAAVSQDAPAVLVRRFSEAERELGVFAHPLGRPRG
jgi:hypothetical protein